MDADDVLEELTFTAQKKLTDIAKCVRHFSTRKTQPRLFHARHNTQDTQPDTHISPLHTHTHLNARDTIECGLIGVRRYMGHT